MKKKKDICRFCNKEIGQSVRDHLVEEHPLMFIGGAILLSPLIFAAAIFETKTRTINVSVRKNHSGFSGPFYDE